MKRLDKNQFVGFALGDYRSLFNLHLPWSDESCNVYYTDSPWQEDKGSSGWVVSRIIKKNSNECRKNYLKSNFM